MGFNKRFVTRELILSTPKEFLHDLFNVDGLIMDDWSSNFINEFYEGLDKEEIIEKLDVNKKS